jgi:hypothetical protein
MHGIARPAADKERHMHRSLRHRFGFVVLTLALVVVTCAGEASAGQGRGFMASDQRGSSKAPGVTGSWALEIKPSPGGGLPPELKGLITFDEGGGCVETIILPPVTPAHGAWLRTGRREFTFTVVHHLVDPAGNFVGTVKATSRATFVGEDQFQAVFDGTLFDPAGNVVAPISGTERGTRILAESP